MENIRSIQLTRNTMHAIRSINNTRTEFVEDSKQMLITV